MKIFIFAMLIAVAGCAGAPVGWGGTDEVLFSSADTIKLQWDSLTTTEDAVRQKAVVHCSGRGVEVVDAGSDSSTLGLVRSKTWRCVAPRPETSIYVQPQHAGVATTLPYIRQQPDRPTVKVLSGTDTIQAEKYAREQSCSAEPHASLAAKGAGFETFSLACTNGDTMMVRCEFGNCRALR